jgi:hypothetical protein
VSDPSIRVGSSTQKPLVQAPDPAS